MPNDINSAEHLCFRMAEHLCFRMCARIIGTLSQRVSLDSVAGKALLRQKHMADLAFTDGDICILLDEILNEA